MSIKLKKLTSTEWQGNGFGTSCATWEIVGYPGYILRGSTGDWSVFNSDNRRVCTGGTRKEAAEIFVSIQTTKES